MDDRTRLLHSLSIDRSTPAAPPRRRRPWPILAGGLVAGLAAAAAVWLLVPRDSSAPPPATGVAATAPAPATTSGQAPASAPTAAPAARPRSGLSASGYVVARRKATVAAEITGKVTEVLVEEGMVVEQGQVVARIYSKLVETDLALSRSRSTAAEAAVNAITADLAEAERIFTRTESLSQKNFASEADLTRTRARVHVLRAQLAQAQAQLATARLETQRWSEVLEQHSVKAPFAGVVVDRSAQAGEMVSPMSAGGSFTRTGICTIVDMASIEIEVDVNEAFIGRVQKGGAVRATLDAYPDWTIPAYVIAIVPTANREKATVKVRIGLREKDPRVLPDMAVKVIFVENETAAAPSPASASSLPTPAPADSGSPAANATAAR
ncbi:Multidrug resistance protein MdtA [Rhodoplanes serenus]|uniref:Multidrug resistance protein MdtA n=1 Tax=Rhodoplanes serenus TaxID=200615 RepID=A0A3S4BTE6_9BRAD|nr:efflux RND transporter periplasmic adaptor subunit [Rhodoplanes serenus]MBI5113496.1 efflux RND transporter periplasmic adaptor subunit [Rhodovulum sp.]VCU06898.1 Multidrug resistance protein MdtA [Rhodoplanes serenus]